MTGLVAVALAFAVVAFSPGPANLACAAVAMAQGRAAGLRFGLGLSLGLAAWGVLAAIGLGAVMAASGFVLTALKVVGGLYLLWLAWGSARSAYTGEGLERAGRGRGFRSGLLLNLTNPKAVFAWMAALAVGLGEGSGLVSLTAATLMCMAIGAVNYAAWALLFSTGSAMAAYSRARRWIEGVAAALFAATGLGLLRSALAR